MNRYRFIKPKPVFDQALILRFVTENPDLSSSQIAKGLNSEHHLGVDAQEIHNIIFKLRGKTIKISKIKGPRGGMTYESL